METVNSEHTKTHISDLARTFSPPPSQTELIEKMTENRNNKIPEYARGYIIIKGLKNCIKIKIINKSFEEIIIYNYILNLLGFISNYIDNATEKNLKIVDWYFIDLIINKDKIIVRGFFYDLGFYIEDKIVTEGLLELESIINDMN